MDIYDLAMNLQRIVVKMKVIVKIVNSNKVKIKHSCKMSRDHRHYVANSAFIINITRIIQLMCVATAVICEAREYIVRAT